MTFQFNSISEFFTMGGHGFYVWLSYSITFVALGLLIWQSKRDIQKTLKSVQKEIARETRKNSHNSR